MTALEDIEWFIDHTCNLNHTGIPQVWFLTNFPTC